MDTLRPDTPAELAEALGASAAAGRAIRLAGASTKCAMAGPVEPADVQISTAGLNRILKYEPGDLTISVEAGLPVSELRRVLAGHKQMVPLDPPFSSSATVGGVLAANTSGPRRRHYGTARDMVIGMKFATLDGKLVESGGMVVKNVAGLDTAKLMIGSFGTLAAIAVANFKVVPVPPFSRTLALPFDSLDEAMASRDRILRGVLQPSALDLLNPPAAARLGRRGYVLLVRAGGSAAVTERYSRELSPAEILEDQGEQELWTRVEEFTPEFLTDHPNSAVVRVSSTLSGVRDVMAAAPGPVLARAATGTAYAYFEDWREAGPWIADATSRGWRAAVEFTTEDAKRQLDLWPCAGDDVELMRRLKHMFDPQALMNRGRLYGRI